MQPVNLRSVDLNLLVVLQVLLEERHVTQTANRLHMTQPAVSHALNRLRELFADPLLVRSGSRMLPTSRALGLIREIDEILAGVSALLSSTPFDPATVSAAVRLCATDGAIAAILARPIAAIAARAPNIQFSLSSNVERAYGHLEEGRIDLAFDVPRDGLHAAFRTLLLFRSELVCVTRRGLWAGAASRRTVDRYMSASHLEIVGGINSHINQALLSHGLRRDIAISVPSYLVAAELVTHGDMVLTLPVALANHAARLFPLEIHALPLDLPPVPFSMIWHRSSEAVAAQNWVRDQLADAVARHEGDAA
ncbi:LysR family transcriptional regulator [Sphingomonas oleivorans]|nr:LysR family transcriptional regulator [Sphingomonas oleivorans]